MIEHMDMGHSTDGIDLHWRPTAYYSSNHIRGSILSNRNIVGNGILYNHN